MYELRHKFPNDLTFRVLPHGIFADGGGGGGGTMPPQEKKKKF